MDYRFYIYKQSVLINFDKYDFSHYALLREITNISQWDLQTERDKEWFTVIRTKFAGNITVQNSDYNALIALEETHLQYAIIIHQKCDGIYSLKWKGLFSYFDFKVDLDRCFLSFEPTVWDAYSPIYDEMDIDRNVLTADVDFIPTMYGFQFPVEQQVYSALGFGLPVNAVWTEHPDFPGELFYLYSQTSIFIEYVSGFMLYEVSQVYKRNYWFMPDNITPPSIDPTWTAYSQESTGEWKWIRPFLGSLYQTYSYQASGNDVYEILDTTGTEIIPLYGCKRLSKVMEYFAQLCRITYQSAFFNNSPCPMGGTSLNWTMLQQISNLRAFGEQATKGMMKLKDLLSWIRDTFNVYWFIDSAGDWRFEHRAYFDNGLSYTYTHTIEIDLTSLLYGEYINAKNKYEYNKPSLARFEKLEIQFSSFTDWVEAGIEYPQLSILGNETKARSVGWGTDIIAMHDGRNELPKQGWVLLNVELDGAFYRVTNTVGALSGVSMQNARFSQANLMRDLWKWGRLLPTGKVNGAMTTFSSIEKLKKQVELFFPQCCMDVDYNGLFRTELGDGIIDTATYESKSGTLKINLIYE